MRRSWIAAYLHVDGLTRPGAEHVLNSFFLVRKSEERDFGEYRTRRHVLDAYECMAVAMSGGPALLRSPAPPPVKTSPCATISTVRTGLSTIHTRSTGKVL